MLSLEVVGVGDVAKAHVEQLTLGIAGDCAHHPVDLQPPAVEAYERHADRSMLERPLEALGGFKQRAFDLLVLP